MVEVELPYLLDFLKFYPLPPYTSDNDLLARLSKLWVTMADNQAIASMPNKLAIALKWNDKMTDDWSVGNCDNFCID
jgi:hypothetical protein